MQLEALRPAEPCPLTLPCVSDHGHDHGHLGKGSERALAPGRAMHLLTLQAASSSPAPGCTLMWLLASMRPNTWRARSTTDAGTPASRAASMP